ncbi:MAG: hypothetical protein QM793_00375 [Muricomes sp.]
MRLRKAWKSVLACVLAASLTFGMNMTAFAEGDAPGTETTVEGTPAAGTDETQGTQGTEQTGDNKDSETDGQTQGTLDATQPGGESTWQYNR